MTRRKRGGFRVPANYEPGRAPKKGGRSYRGRPGGSADDDGGRREADASQKRDRPRDHSRDTQTGTRDPGTRQSAPRDTQAHQTQRPSPAAPAVFESLSTHKTVAADIVGVTFADLGLGGNIVRTLAELGADQPFPIQVATIPDTIAGRDVLGKARTGSGKTIAFGAALVERMLRLKADGAFGEQPGPARGGARRGVRAPVRPRRNPKALILAPTRELALQIDRTVQPLARAVGFYTAQLVGGVPLDPQLHALERGADIIIGTPGRIQDLVNRGRLELREVRVSVIDEADHMCDLGFLEPVQRVLRGTARGGQRLLFSATLDTSVRQLIDEFLRRPVAHEVEEWAASVEHRVLIVLREDKDRALVELASQPGRTMVFCRTRAYAERVGELLTGAGLRVTTLHGDLSQIRRERNLERFATGSVDVLVATDVAARGIHIDDVDLVLQADPPDDPKVYLHRAGRTGRTGRAGRVVTLIPRTRQQRTRELFEQATITPSFFGDYVPGAGVT